MLDYPLTVNHAFSSSDLKTLEMSLKQTTEDVRSLKRPRSPAEIRTQQYANKEYDPSAGSSASSSISVDPKKPPDGYVFENHKLKKLKAVENKIIYVSGHGKSRVIKHLSVL